MLSISNLALAYGNAEPVLENVDLEVPQGEFISLVGPSGCGKSTLLRAVMGLQAPHGGHAELDIPAHEVGILFQDDALLPWRTACENVALGLRIHGTDKRAARAQANEWLAAVGLAQLAHRYPRELSGGQRKRVAIAQVLALRPKLLLMDEPFASLDAIVRHYLTEDLLKWVEGEGLTVLMVTHDLEEAVSVSDRVVLLGNGPRAHVKCRFEVPIARPRDPMRAREHPEFIPLLERLWDALSEEVHARPNGADNKPDPEAAR
ncbi:ABC transporter ATP-binding protein [Salinisphaera sp. USBA-960]|uniref:ABC transporter ATP-binding protein n=1 Tax=Salinisphaera orenii TaxID=856731 RepID=UPI000DBE8E83|nr:ABC transporter ATP-binding protein [Salifodinibacter halophilus]NNC26615.1 ABC transporter ATP-binding protein [Salifodinibacter halophilus]